MRAAAFAVRNTTRNSQILHCVQDDKQPDNIALNYSDITTVKTINTLYIFPAQYSGNPYFLP